MTSHKIGKIEKCMEEDCVYNHDMECRTPGITVGDRHPECDTFMRGDSKAGMDGIGAMVGACKVSDCKFNSSMECSAESVEIGTHSGHPDCFTYSK